MRIRAGYDIIHDCPVETPMVLLLNVHPSRAGDLETPDLMTASPEVRMHRYRDLFGNVATRVVAPPGPFRLTADFVITDTGAADPASPDACQHLVEDLPDEAMTFLLPSRYCETEHLSNMAWSMFGGVEPGWKRVQAICDYVHSHITFGYHNARKTRTAFEAWQEQVGVCRDFAHLAVALCRCMNIPARYCTGFLGDIGVSRVTSPMDFSAWFEVYLGGAWHTFDARHNAPRIGRILMARGRDATDVAIATIFGAAWLEQFTVITEELK
ncbi:transglutaminase-like domain-containing protein [Phenylobacterium immobile]|uniref:transglutaminase-like domain-containing protein n=1 Tax=Phenylobacterium immobile TaxID=21 RepID=UPI000A9B0EEA|nr:transglutaminase family protein [Phenylobacterium immobile]